MYFLHKLFLTAHPFLLDIEMDAELLLMQHRLFIIQCVLVMSVERNFKDGEKVTNVICEDTSSSIALLNFIIISIVQAWDVNIDKCHTPLSVKFC